MCLNNCGRYFIYLGISNSCLERISGSCLFLARYYIYVLLIVDITKYIRLKGSSGKFEIPSSSYLCLVISILLIPSLQI